MFDKKFLVDQIKTFVTIRDIFDKYVGTAPDAHGRYQCPFNKDEDRKNFGIKHNHIWHCFSCGSTGDQITLVQKLFDIPFNDAILKIASDFNLATEQNEAMSLKMKIETQKRLLQREKSKRRQRFIEFKSKELFEYLIGLSRIVDRVIDATNPNELTKAYYAYNNKCKINIEAREKKRQLDYYINILTEMPLEEDYVTYADKDILHNRAANLVDQYIKGELKL